MTARAALRDLRISSPADAACSTFNHACWWARSACDSRLLASVAPATLLASRTLSRRAPRSRALLPRLARYRADGPGITLFRPARVAGRPTHACARGAHAPPNQCYAHVLSRPSLCRRSRRCYCDLTCPAWRASAAVQLASSPLAFAMHGLLSPSVGCLSAITLHFGLSTRLGAAPPCHAGVNRCRAYYVSFLLPWLRVP